MRHDVFSKEADGLIKIVSTFGGFNAQEVMLRCFTRSKSDTINVRTVCAVLQEMKDEGDARRRLEAQAAIALDSLMEVTREAGG